MRPATTLPAPRRIPSIPAIAGFLVLVLLAALLTLTGTLARVQRVIPGLSQPSPTYQTTTVSRGNLVIAVTATGPVAAVDDIPLSFKSSGLLAKVNVNVGDNVKEGQVLAVLDTTDLQNALEQAQANLANAQAGLEKLQEGPTIAQVEVARTAINTAKSDASDAKLSLNSSQTVASKDVATAQASVAAAETNLKTANDAVTSAQSQETAGLAADQTALATAQKNLTAEQATVAADLPVLEQAISQAKDSLYAAQTTRDSACVRPGASCNADNATVDGAQTAVNSAQSALVESQKQQAQQIATDQAAVDSAQASLANDRTKLDAAVVAAQNQVKQDQAAVNSAQTALAQAQSSASGTVQTAQGQVDQANSSIQTAQSNYNEVVAPATPSDIAAAQAQVANAQDAVNQAQVNLAAAQLTAPFNGTIAVINGTPGQWIPGGPVGTVGSAATAFMTMVNLNDLQVTADVNEADIGKVAVGNPVTFDVSAYPNQTFSGKVVSIQPIGTTVQNVVNYEVTSSIQQGTDKSSQLYPGMTATVNIVSAEHDNVLQVPNTAFSFAQSAFRRGLITLASGASTTGTGARQRPTGAGTGAGGGQRATGGNNGQGGQRSANGSSGGFGQGGTGTGRTGQGSSNRAVVIVLKGDQLTPVPVTTGLTDGINTEIVSGLTGNEQVIVGPISTSTGGTGTQPGGPRPAANPLAGGFRG